MTSTPTINSVGHPSNTARNDAITVLGISVRGKDHFTRLWPTTKDGSLSGFLFVMLPIRFLALAMLWATSAPRRLAVPVTVAAIIAACLLLGRHDPVLHWFGVLAGGR